MANPILLMSSEGNILLSVSAVMDTGEECIFVDKEFSTEKSLVFRSKGTFKYVIENKCNLGAELLLQDSNDNVMNATDFIGPYSIVNIHYNLLEDKLLSFDPKKEFKLTIKNLKGTWKLSNGIDDEREVKYEDEQGSSTFCFNHSLQHLVFLSHEPVKEKEKKYMENGCCICLEEEKEELCTLIKCGHKCCHMKCFFNNDGLPNFTKCPLCRMNVIAVSIK